MNEPRTLTEALVRINAKVATLQWADKLFGRAAIQDIKKTGGDRPQLIPMAFKNEYPGEYEDCRPNDQYQSVVFYVAKDPEKNEYNLGAPTHHARNHILRTRRAITLIGWVNMSQLPDYNDGSGFPELIKLELKNALRSVRCIVAIGDFQDGMLNEVFKPFVVSDMDRKYDRFPFFCFRLDLTIMTIEANP